MVLRPTLCYKTAVFKKNIYIYDQPHNATVFHEHRSCLRTNRRGQKHYQFVGCDILTVSTHTNDVSRIVQSNFTREEIELLNAATHKLFTCKSCAWRRGRRTCPHCCSDQSTCSYCRRRARRPRTREWDARWEYRCALVVRNHGPTTSHRPEWRQWRRTWCPDCVYSVGLRR